MVQPHQGSGQGIAAASQAVAIIMVLLSGIFIAWIGYVRGTYAINGFRVACCCLILVGLALALAVSFNTLNIAGVALAFLAACGAAGLVVANGDAVGEGGSLIVNFYTSVVALLLVSSLGPMIASITLPGTNAGWFGLIGTGTAFCLGLVLFLAAMPRIGMVRASLISVIEPVLAILFAMAFFSPWRCLVSASPFSSGWAWRWWSSGYSCLNRQSRM